MLRYSVLFAKLPMKSFGDHQNQHHRTNYNFLRGPSKRYIGRAACKLAVALRGCGGLKERGHSLSSRPKRRKDGEQMTRPDYMAFATSALLVVGFADWLYRWRHEGEGQPQALNAATLIGDSGMATEAAVQSALLGASGGGARSAAWGNPNFSSELRESPSDVAAGDAETEGAYA
jgi:hypothetical protein